MLAYGVYIYSAFGQCFMVLLPFPQYDIERRTLEIKLIFFDPKVLLIQNLTLNATLNLINPAPYNVYATDP